MDLNRSKHPDMESGAEAAPWLDDEKTNSHRRRHRGPQSGWDEAMAARLEAVSEEALLTLLGEGDSAPAAEARRLLVTARWEGGGTTLEFVASRGESNLEDRMAVLGEAGAADAARAAMRIAARACGEAQKSLGSK